MRRWAMTAARVAMMLGCDQLAALPATRTARYRDCLLTVYAACASNPEPVDFCARVEQENICWYIADAQPPLRRHFSATAPTETREIVIEKGKILKNTTGEDVR